MDKSNKNKDIAFMLVIYIGLIFATLFVPVLAIVTIFFLPLPFILSTKKHGMKQSLIVFVGALVFSSLFIPSYTLPLTLVFGIGGLIIGQGMREQINPFETLARGAAGYMIGIILFVLLGQAVFNVDVFGSMEKMLDDSLEMSRSMVQQFGVEQGTDQVELFEEQIAIMKDLLPAYFAVVAGILAWVTQWISYKLLNRGKTKEMRLSYPPFRTFRLPNGIIFVYLIVLAIFLFGNLEQGTTFALIVNNVVMILETLLVLHGLAFIFFLVHRKGWPKVLSIISVVLVLLLPGFLLLVRLLGIIDLGLRLRERMSIKS